jgi:hypothetical protein
MNTDLVVAVVQALHPDAGYVAQWRQALQIISGERAAAAQVRVQDALPQDPAEFTGRATELTWLRSVLVDGRQNGRAVVISVLEDMASRRTVACSPAPAPWWCWITPPTPTRSGPCFPTLLAASR